MGSTLETLAPSDGELARQITAGSSVAERALYVRFAPRIRLYGLRHLGAEDAAADLVQRVITVSIEKLRAGQVREPDRITSFVLGTARMITREIRREHKREIPTESLPDLEDLESRAAEPLARDHLARCLGALDERERAIVALTYFAEQTTGEIASALALGAGNVRVIRHRAIRRLRECMGIGP